MSDYEFHLRDEWRECVDEIKVLVRDKPRLTILEIFVLTGTDIEMLPVMHHQAVKELDNE